MDRDLEVIVYEFTDLISFSKIREPNFSGEDLIHYIDNILEMDYTKSQLAQFLLDVLRYPHWMEYKSIVQEFVDTVMESQVTE